MIPTLCIYTFSVFTTYWVVLTIWNKTADFIKHRTVQKGSSSTYFKQNQKQPISEQQMFYKQYLDRQRVTKHTHEQQALQQHHRPQQQQQQYQEYNKQGSKLTSASSGVSSSYLNSLNQYADYASHLHLQVPTKKQSNMSNSSGKKFDQISVASSTNQLNVAMIEDPQPVQPSSNKQQINQIGEGKDEEHSDENILNREIDQQAVNEYLQANDDKIITNSNEQADNKLNIQGQKDNILLPMLQAEQNERYNQQQKQQQIDNVVLINITQPNNGVDFRKIQSQIIQPANSQQHHVEQQPQLSQQQSELQIIQALNFNSKLGSSSKNRKPNNRYGMNSSLNNRNANITSSQKSLNASDRLSLESDLIHEVDMHNGGSNSEQNTKMDKLVQQIDELFLNNQQKFMQLMNKYKIQESPNSDSVPASQNNLVISQLQQQQLQLQQVHKQLKNREQELEILQIQISQYKAENEDKDREIKVLKQTIINLQQQKDTSKENHQKERDVDSTKQYREMIKQLTLKLQNSLEQNKNFDLKFSHFSQEKETQIQQLHQNIQRLQGLLKQQENIAKKSQAQAEQLQKMVKDKQFLITQLAKKQQSLNKLLTQKQQIIEKEKKARQKAEQLNIKLQEKINDLQQKIGKQQQIIDKGNKQQEGTKQPLPYLPISTRQNLPQIQGSTPRSAKSQTPRQPTERSIISNLKQLPLEELCENLRNQLQFAQSQIRMFEDVDYQNNVKIKSLERRIQQIQNSNHSAEIMQLRSKISRMQPLVNQYETLQRRYFQMKLKYQKLVHAQKLRQHELERQRQKQNMTFNMNNKLGLTNRQSAYKSPLPATHLIVSPNKIKEKFNASFGAAGLNSAIVNEKRLSAGSNPNERNKLADFSSPISAKSGISGLSYAAKSGERSGENSRIQIDPDVQKKLSLSPNSSMQQAHQYKFLNDCPFISLHQREFIYDTLRNILKGILKTQKIYSSKTNRTKNPHELIDNLRGILLLINVQPSPSSTPKLLGAYTHEPFSPLSPHSCPENIAFLFDISNRRYFTNQSGINSINYNASSLIWGYSQIMIKWEEPDIMYSNFCRNYNVYWDGKYTISEFLGNGSQNGGTNQETNQQSTQSNGINGVQNISTNRQWARINQYQIYRISKI